MMREAISLSHADILREGTIMAQDDVTKFAGQRPLEQIKRKSLIIGDEITEFSILKMDRGHCIVIFCIKRG